MKICSTCWLEKSEADFFKNKSAKDGLTYSCQDCSRKYHRDWNRANPRNRNAYKKSWRDTCPGAREKDRAYAKAWRKSNPEKAKELDRNNNLKRFGLSSDSYSTMLNSQGGVCAICEKGCATYTNLSVDHIHGTNPPIVRGLLCAACNQAIGLLKDSPGLLLKAAAYLCKGKEKQEAA